MTPDTIGTLLVELMGACLDAYADAGQTPPGRQFLAHGQPIWEGEQMTVAWTSLRPVFPHPLELQRAPKTNVIPAVDFSVEVVRSCWPQPAVGQATASLPAPESFSAASLRLAVDASTLACWLQRLSVEGGMFPSFPTISTSQDVRVGSIVPTGPQGAHVGIRFPVQVALVIP